MKQLYCPHRVTVSGILQYCSNGKSPMDCEHCDCPDKKEFDVTVTTSSSEILSNKMKSDAEVADDLGITPSEYRDLVTNALFEEKPKSKNMTREEERRQASKEYVNNLDRLPSELRSVQQLYSIDDFKEGAKWADKTMIEKACEWLRLTQPQVIMPDTTIERFKKAMEE